jgi:lipopolysaccharide export system ATP-binding protein
LVNEPSAGVDPIGVAEIQRRFCDEEDLGVLIRDHNVKEMLRICDRACMVHHGCVVASGGAEELYTTTCT